MSGVIHSGAVISQSPKASPNDKPVAIGASIAAAGAQPKWVKVAASLSFTTFQAAALTKSNTLFSLPAGGVIHGIKLKHSVAFAGTSISALTLEIGIAGTTNKYLRAADVLQAVSATAEAVQATTGSESHDAATNILILATAIGANLSALSAGTVDVWALLSNVS